MSKRNRSVILRASLLAVVGLAGLAMGSVGRGSLYGPPVGLEIGDRAEVTVVNAGPRPARVELVFIRADDFSPVATSGPVALPPESSISLNLVADSPHQVLAVVRYRTSGATLLLASLQVKNPTGDTQIFADGFESGDTS